MMSNASLTGTPAEAISVLKGMMPMLDLRDPHDNAFEMVNKTLFCGRMSQEARIQVYII